MSIVSPAVWIRGSYSRDVWYCGKTPSVLEEEQLEIAVLLARKI
jgi:hypothetical protein